VIAALAIVGVILILAFLIGSLISQPSVEPNLTRQPPTVWRREVQLGEEFTLIPGETAKVVATQEIFITAVPELLITCVREDGSFCTQYGLELWVNGQLYYWNNLHADWSAWEQQIFPYQIDYLSDFGQQSAVSLKVKKNQHYFAFGEAFTLGDDVAGEKVEEVYLLSPDRSEVLVIVQAYHLSPSGDMSYRYRYSEAAEKYYQSVLANRKELVEFEVVETDVKTYLTLIAKWQ
jgi:hypothetical protein